MALDARARGLVGFDLAAELVAEVGTESLGSERWLMLYEAVRNGWLPDAVIQKDDFLPFFERLRHDDVSFYNSEVELEKINRPLDKLHGITMPVVGFVFDY